MFGPPSLGRGPEEVEITMRGDERGIKKCFPGNGRFGVPRGRNALHSPGNSISFRTVCLRARGSVIGPISGGISVSGPPGPGRGPGPGGRGPGLGPWARVPPRKPKYPPEIGPITLPRALKHTVRKEIKFPTASRVLRPRGTPKRPNPGKQF